MSTTIDNPEFSQAHIIYILTYKQDIKIALHNCLPIANVLSSNLAYCFIFESLIHLNNDYTPTTAVCRYHMYVYHMYV